MIIPNKLYDILKWVAMLFLPALATLVATLCHIWGISYGPQISETIIAIDAFLGAILGISSIHHANLDFSDIPEPEDRSDEND